MLWVDYTNDLAPENWIFIFPGLLPHLSKRLHKVWRKFWCKMIYLTWESSKKYFPNLA